MSSLGPIWGSAGGAQASAGGQVGGVAVSAYSYAGGQAGTGGQVTMTGGNSHVPASPEDQQIDDLADYFDVTQAWATVNEAGGTGRKVDTHHKLSYVNGDTPFHIEIISEMDTPLFKALRGRFFTSFRVFVGHPTINPKKKTIEIAMAYPDAIAQTAEEIRNHWVSRLGTDTRDFFRVVYWDLWTWEKPEPHYHDMYCSLDGIKR